VVFSGEPLDKTAGAAADCNDLPSIGVNFMDPAERLAVQRPHLGIAKIGKPHHSAPQRGIHARTLSSTE
jgi:hypothetical protein